MRESSEQEERFGRLVRLRSLTWREAAGGEGLPE